MSSLTTNRFCTDHQHMIGTGCVIYLIILLFLDDDPKTKKDKASQYIHNLPERDPHKINFGSR
jgi:hypothetical protein